MSKRALGPRQQNLLERLESDKGLLCPHYYGDASFGSLLQRLADPDDLVVYPGQRALLRFEVDEGGLFTMFINTIEDQHPALVYRDPDMTDDQAEAIMAFVALVMGS